MKIWLIRCRTGCTCCSSENHYRGPYKTSEDANRRKSSFLRENSKFWPLASQYARHGSYDIEEFEAEELPDGRIIVCDRVFPKCDFIDVGPEGEISRLSPIGESVKCDTDSEIFYDKEYWY